MNRQIAKTIIQDHLISTVKLPGFDNGEIDAYETMVFKVDADDAWTERDVQRYGLREDAEIGHRVMVSRWEKILNPVEACFDCGDPTADDYLIDENEYGEQQKLPICPACRFDRFGKDED